MGDSKNIYLIGMMGAGKSLVGRALAERLSRPFIDADDAIEKLAGKSISKIFLQEGEGIFRHLEGRVIRGLSAHRNVVAALGGGAVERSINLARLSVSGRIIWLDFPVNVLLKRIEDEDHRPLLAHLSETEKHDKLVELLESRRQAYKQSHIHLQYRQETPVRTIVSDILQQL